MIGRSLRVSVCANYAAKDEAGEWQERPYWNEVTIFEEEAQKRVKERISKGDLVFARGRLKQSSYEKDGETRYTVALNCDEFSRLARASDPED